MATRIIGAHVSAAGGIDKAVERAAAIGCNGVQVFSGSPRIWKRTPLELVDVSKLASEQQKYGVGPIFTHALYLVNLASDKPELRQKSIAVLKHDLGFDSLVKGSGVVVHLGSHQGRGWEAVAEQVVAGIIEVLQDTPADSRFLIENSAGQQGKLCSDLSEIRWIFDQVKAKLGAGVLESRLGWCFDTCHGFCAGYNLETLGKTITDLDLWDGLTVIHVNDSRDPFDSGRDRHANLGDGNIPPTALKQFLNLPQVKRVPLMLEVPGLDGNGPDAENVDRLKKIVS